MDDGTTSTQTTFDVTVTAINDAPTDIALSGSAVDENSANGTIVGSVSGTDIDAGDSVTFALTDNAGGRFAVDLNTGQLTVAFSSLLNFEDSAAHTITVRATDTGGLSRDESYTITVNDVNEAPTGVGDTFSVRQLEDLVVPAGVILTNDFDADGDSLSVVLVSGPTEGAFALAADGSFTYTSAGSFSGQDEFTYYVTDGTLNSAVTTVNIDVTNSISGVGPIDSVDPETLEDPVDTTPAENSDTTAEDSSSEETSAKDTVSGTTGSSSGQTDDSFVNGDTPDEIPQQVGSEPFISIMLVDVPEAGRLKNDSSIQRDGFEETVIGEALQLDRHLFHQVVTDNPLFGSGHVNPSDVDIHESQDDQWRKDQIVEQVVVGSTAVVTTSVSVGYVMWLLRGGSLLTTFLSSLPAWQAFDPLAVLESFNETGDENNDGESLASLVSGDI
ncbi:MAG: Ig-like domain-containing protein [Fuerstiella sp.]|nr:Ig-like domain-containing protein [Fuerstiella sp.]